MDLFLANFITTLFAISAHLLVKKKQLIRPQKSYFAALTIVASFLCCSLLVGALLALIMGELLPLIYVNTFAIKTVFVLVILTIYWIWQAIKIQKNNAKLSH